MIEREFIRSKAKNLSIKEKIASIIPKNAGVGSIIIEKTPISETITIDAVRPGLIIGRRGETIKMITDKIKQKYGLDNPQIKVREITEPNLNARAVARGIASNLERFGSMRYKSVGHRTVTSIMEAGALGTEIILSGKLPGKRARSWRFSKGYMKKCGQISDIYVDKAIESATLPSGIVGIKVRILRADVQLPDRIKIIEPEKLKEEKIEEVKVEKPKVEEKIKPKAKKVAPEKKIAKKETKKKAKPKAKKKAKKSAEKKVKK